MDVKKGKYRDAGLRLTPQRLAILAYLEGNRQHPSAEDVYRAVRRKFPTMSFATVYNTLETLKRQGAVAELSLEAGRKRFDPDTRPHHHLICIICKRIVDVYSASGPALPRAARAGFKVLGSHIEFYGLCPSCRAA
jgi:Fur family peroxide stress response transcriptional regulator